MSRPSRSGACDDALRARGAFLPGLIELDRSRMGVRPSGAAVELLERLRHPGRVRLHPRRAGRRGSKAPGPRFGALRPRAGVPLGLGAYLSFARGALAALAVGLLLLVALAPDARPGAEYRRRDREPRRARRPWRASAERQVARRERDAGEGLVMLGVLVLLAPEPRPSLAPGRRGAARASRRCRLPAPRRRRACRRRRGGRRARGRCIRGHARGTPRRSRRGPRPTGLDRHQPLPVLEGRGARSSGSIRSRASDRVASRSSG